ncbi:MAG: class I SAM-dependent methyltransferase [bacterium]
MTPEEVKELTAAVEGWLTEPEGELLFRLASQCTGRGVIVEIGSWKGKSTIWLAMGLENSAAAKQTKIFAIDPHSGSSEHQEMYGEVRTFEEFKANIANAQINHLIVPLVKASEQAADEMDQAVELVFIDGAHEYEFVKLDFELWFPKVIDGGIMAFHDTTLWPGPKRVVRDLVFKSRRFRRSGFIHSITFAQKVERNSLFDCIRNRYILFLKNTNELVGKLHIPKLIRTIGRRILRFIQGI